MPLGWKMIRQGLPTQILSIISTTLATLTSCFRWFVLAHCPKMFLTGASSSKFIYRNTQGKDI